MPHPHNQTVLSKGGGYVVVDSLLLRSSCVAVLCLVLALLCMQYTKVISSFAINALWKRELSYCRHAAVSVLYVSFPRGADSLSVVCDCGIFRFLLTHLIVYVYALITKSSADPETDWESRPPSPGKSCHNRPTSEAPLKWGFAGGPMMARLEYWYIPPPLCKI